MKFVQEFELDEPVAVLWPLFDQPERIAGCVPGMNSIETLDPDTFLVRVTQRVGPISATFESRVVVTERVEGERMRLTTTGKAVRGAIGNFRAESTVILLPLEDGKTRIRVESEAALAGVLGSVGQKIIAREAEKIAAEFARNLQAMMRGDMEPVPEASPSARPAPTRPAAYAGSSAATAPSVSADGWSRAAAMLGLVNAMIGIAILISLT